MARMGGSKHLKRLAAPWFWPILRKEYKWVVKPSPGPHPIDRSLPLLVVIRDVLGLAETAREAKRIIFDGKVYIDGVVRKDYKFPVGVMDTISIPDIDFYARFVPYPVK
ncbi:MAG: S4 domain-containing protein, partial [Ignisphaera sp.]